LVSSKILPDLRLSVLIIRDGLWDSEAIDEASSSWCQSRQELWRNLTLYFSTRVHLLGDLGQLTQPL
jgi:hypothetical protein